MSNAEIPMAAKIHQGRNVKRFREMLGMKQEAFADALGEEWTQRRVSLMEAKEEIEEDLLEQVAMVLKVPVEAIKNFDEEKAINIISNTFQDFKGNAVASAMNYQCSFNPLEKLIEAMEENKKLYERLLQSERDKNELLERMLKEK